MTKNRNNDLEETQNNPKNQKEDLSPSTSHLCYVFRIVSSVCVIPDVFHMLTHEQRHTNIRGWTPASGQQLAQTYSCYFCVLLSNEIQVNISVSVLSH